MSPFHHYSIPVQDTPHVAEVLQGCFGGTITPFRPYPNAYIVWFGDEHGSAIELFPMGTAMFPDAGDGQANFRHNSSFRCSRRSILGNADYTVYGPDELPNK